MENKKEAELQKEIGRLDGDRDDLIEILTLECHEAKLKVARLKYILRQYGVTFEEDN